ncbi:BF3164 family lipoprotein, partial [Bacteroides thetaiotaomicron]
KNTYVIMLFVVIMSCTSKEVNKSHIVDISSLKGIELNFIEYPIEPMLGNPYEIEYIEPYLIMDNLVDDKVLLIYNVNNDSYVNTLSVGNGPDDILFPIEIQVKDQEVYIMERQSGKCRKYLLSALLHDSVSNFKETMLSRSDRMAKTNDAYIGSGIYDSGMICIFNEESKVLKEVDIYPDYFDALKDSGRKYKLGQSRLCFNAKHNRLILAPLFLNSINIYSYQHNDLEKVDSLTIGKNLLKKRILENEGNVDIEGTDIYHCVDVCCSKDFFYVLYNGAKMEKKNDNTLMYILKLAMDGTLSKKYNVNSRIRNICVSEDDTKMYAILLNEDLDYVVAKTEL